MTLWDQLGGRTWSQRANAQPGDGSGPPRRRQSRRRKLAQARRRPAPPPPVRD
jgi:DMSO/TMAO reductase YedYZ molybdopterin-dependent catalytic subunit